MAAEKREHIVIVDDNPVNLEYAENVLQDRYKLTKLISGKQLLKLLQRVKPDMILLDIQMPDMNGYQVMELIKENEEWNDIPVIFITAQNDVASERKGFQLGAKDFIIKPFDTAIMLSRIQTHIELYNYRKGLEEVIREKTKKIEDLQHVITVSWAEVIESRDGSTGSHVRNTSRYYEGALRLLSKRPEFISFLTKDVCEDLVRASALHDIGKIGISDTVLKKPGALTREEFDYMKQHSKIGGDMIQKIIDSTYPDNLLIFAKEMALCHHERWDGLGYPKGLKGEEIPFYVCALSIVDVFDALTSVRPYKRAFSMQEAIEIMKKDRGKFFCPALFDLFLDNYDEVQNLLMTKQD